MTSDDKTKAFIEDLRESITLAQNELAEAPSAEARAAIRQSIAINVAEIRSLTARLEGLDA